MRRENTQINVREERYNVLLAELLKERKLKAEAEVIHTSSRRPDIQIAMSRAGSNQHMRMLEAKKGTRKPQKDAAVNHAETWLTDPYCEAVIALCYPEDLVPDMDAMRDCDRYVFTPLEANGVPIGWITGGIAELDSCIRNAELSGGAKLAQLLSDGVDNFTRGVNDAVRARFANTLGVKDPTNATAIAGLLIINGMMLHEQLADKHKTLSRKLDPLTKLAAKQQSKGALQTLLDPQWRLIREVDYAAVIDPVRALLNEFGSHRPAPLHAALQTAVACAPLLKATQLDYAGPVYHGLLESRFDGSFYTKTSSGVLLSELAIQHDLVDDWTDVNALARLRICDPACGTGTLLMAAQNVIIRRYRANGGNADLLPKLQVAMIERVLTGLDINGHAIHLAACMLTLAANNAEYHDTHLTKVQHGTNERGVTRCGSLDLLLGDARELPLAGTEDTAQRQTGQGEMGLNARDVVAPNSQDLVTMNPPFTRNSIRNDQYGPEEQTRIQQHEIKIAKDWAAAEHLNQEDSPIDNSSVRTYFTPIADAINKADGGTMAMVIPMAALQGSSGQAERELWTKRWLIECVITSHDNRNIAFSGNTNIHESMIIGRRPQGRHVEPNHPVHFVSLTQNPKTATEAESTANTIRQAMGGGGYRRTFGHWNHPYSEARSTS